MSTRFSLVLVGSGAVAFVDFWAWFASPDLGRVFGLTAFFLSLAAISVTSPRAVLRDRELAAPLLLGVLVALAFTGFAYAQGGLAGVFWAHGGRAGMR